MAVPAQSSRAATFAARLRAMPCCAAITEKSALEAALDSRVPAVFILRGNGLELSRLVEPIHASGKLVAIHLDLVDGISPDRAAVTWLAKAGVDAVISSHGQLMAAIRREGMVAIHRLLMIRHGTVDSAIGAVSRSGADFVEILPGVILPDLPWLKSAIPAPLLAGGFIRDERQARDVLAAGALAVTTSSESLWRTPLG